MRENDTEKNLATSSLMEPSRGGKWWVPMLIGIGVLTLFASIGFAIGYVHRAYATDAASGSNVAVVRLPEPGEIVIVTASGRAETVASCNEATVECLRVAFNQLRAYVIYQDQRIAELEEALVSQKTSAEKPSVWQWRKGPPVAVILAIPFLIVGAITMGIDFILRHRERRKERRRIG